MKVASNPKEINGLPAVSVDDWAGSLNKHNKSLKIRVTPEIKKRILDASKAGHTTSTISKALKESYNVAVSTTWIQRRLNGEIEW